MPETLACRCGRGTLYDVLQVSPWCEPEVIHAAFRALARSRHPDVNRRPDAEEQMRRLNVAYDILSDPSRRARYDEELALEAARQVGPARASAPVSPPPSGHPAGPRGSSSTARPATSGAVGPNPAGPPPVAPAYQTAVFDTRSEMLFPRSAIYVSLLLLTAIVALVAWLILDMLAQRPNEPPRAPRAFEDVRPAGSVWSPWRGEAPGAAVGPGLSPASGRWKS